MSTSEYPTTNKEAALPTQVPETIMAAGNKQGTERVTESPAIQQENGLDAYRFLNLIGEGGMGKVYLAEQDLPKRLVALKLINRENVSVEFLRRFVSEYQLLALMNHQNIARIFDAGTTPKGNPYFTMEYIKGEPIDEYCERQYLPLRDRLKLFLQVCNGVMHAHQRAVVHRDLKPPNVLITVQDKEPLVKIIDFGIAKTLRDDQKDDATRVGSFVGTPAFMSPEQLSGGRVPADTRTDVYALGVLLYELLTDLKPFDPKRFDLVPLDEMLRTYRETDPPLPSERLREAAGDKKHATLRKKINMLRGDLDGIIMKAMAKDPNRRYASVVELKGDILNHLENRPITARPPGMIYLSLKYMRRHTGQVVATVLTFLSLMGGLFFSISAQQKTEKALTDMTAAQRETRKALDFLQEMLRAPDIGDYDLRTMVIKGEEYLKQELKSPELEAAIRFSIGNTAIWMGDYDKAETHLRAALVLRRRLFGEDALETLRCQYDLARTLRKQDRYAEAAELGETVYRQQRELLGENHRETLKSLSSLGEVYGDQNQYDQAEELLNSVLSKQMDALGPQDTDTLLTMVRLGDVYYRHGKNFDAERHYQAAYTRGKGILDLNAPFMLVMMSRYAKLLMNQKKHEPAVSLYEEVAKRRETLFGSQDPRVSSSYYSLALCMYRADRHREAATVFSTVFLRRMEEQGPVGKDTWNAANSLCASLYEIGETPQILDILSAFIESCRDHGIEAQTAQLTAMRVMGHYLRLENRFDEAVALLQEALAVWSGTPRGAQSKAAIITQITLAETFEDQGNQAEALHHYCDATESANLHFGNTEFEAEATLYYAKSLLRFGLLEKAETLLLQLFEEKDGFASGFSGEVTESLRQLYTQWNRPDLAAAYGIR